MSRVGDARYPLLSSGIQEVTWGSARMRFVFELEPPTPELIGNVRAVGFSAERVLLIDTAEFGVSAFPGGTLEPGEDWMQALERELLEEAGARLLDFEVVGRLHFWSGAERPYRAHLPHPEFHQVVGYGEVEIVGKPTAPPDGEHVRAVTLVPLDEAIARIRVREPWDAELLELVAEIRSDR